MVSVAAVMLLWGVIFVAGDGKNVGSVDSVKLEGWMG